jgi:hypothetical protein
VIISLYSRIYLKVKCVWWGWGLFCHAEQSGSAVWSASGSSDMWIRSHVLVIMPQFQRILMGLKHTQWDSQNRSDIFVRMMTNAQSIASMLTGVAATNVFVYLSLILALLISVIGKYIPSELNYCIVLREVHIYRITLETLEWGGCAQRWAAWPLGGTVRPPAMAQGETLNNPGATLMNPYYVEPRLTQGVVSKPKYL